MFLYTDRYRIFVSREENEVPLLSDASFILPAVSSRSTAVDSGRKNSAQKGNFLPFCTTIRDGFMHVSYRYIWLARIEIKETTYCILDLRVHLSRPHAYRYRYCFKRRNLSIQDIGLRVHSSRPHSYCYFISEPFELFVVSYTTLLKHLH